MGIGLGLELGQGIGKGIGLGLGMWLGLGMVIIQSTQPTSGGAVTTVKADCCANCVETPRPQKWVPDLPYFGKPTMRTRSMAGTAPHKSRRCRHKSRSDNNTQSSLDLRYMSQTNTR